MTGKGRNTVKNPEHYDEILLRIEGASVIRFSWDPPTEEFKKDWLSD